VEQKKRRALVADWTENIRNDLEGWGFTGAASRATGAVWIFLKKRNGCYNHLPG